MSIIKRGRFYHLKRRVPKRYAALDPREFVYQSLFTDSEEEAQQMAAEVWKELQGAWEAEIAGHGAIAERRFEAAKELAERRGYRWMPTEKVAELPLDDLLDRVEAAKMKDGQPSRIRAEAFLGGAKEPSLTMTRLPGGGETTAWRAVLAATFSFLMGTSARI